MDVRTNFPGGMQRRHFAYRFQVADVTMQTDAHKTLYCSTPQRKCPMKARALFASIFKSFSSELYTNLPQRCKILSVIPYRFCWIGTYSHNWVWNGPELLLNTFAVLSLVCAGWTERIVFYISPIRNVFSFRKPPGIHLRALSTN